MHNIYVVNAFSESPTLQRIYILILSSTVDQGREDMSVESGKKMHRMREKPYLYVSSFVAKMCHPFASSAGDGSRDHRRIQGSDTCLSFIPTKPNTSAIFFKKKF